MMWSSLSTLGKHCSMMASVCMIESPWTRHVSVRTRFKNARMLKDYKRRKLVEHHYSERLRLNCIRRNDILPVEVKELADTEIHANYPRDSSYTRLVKRCIVTSRPRGLVGRWRVSRFIFRHQSDYNYMSGMMRGMW